jgi:hypothetical protein
LGLVDFHEAYVRFGADHVQLEGSALSPAALPFGLLLLISP